ncbi:MAG: hypothetical protein QGH06_02410, partial [Lutibacter sp.]|nr:hypothetical protein [Lutibacter sp.]
MSILNTAFKLFLGDKKKKDLKLLQPIVQKVAAFESVMTSLSNDALRERTTTFKQQIGTAVKDVQDRIQLLK